MPSCAKPAPVARTHDERTLVVLMGGRRLGELYQARSGGVRLRYDDEYAGDPASVPLSTSMPLTVARHPSSAVEPWIDGLLPERPEVLARWRREFRVRGLSAFALLRHVGEDVAGAAQFVRPERVDDAMRPGPVAVLSDQDIGRRLTALRSDASAWEPAPGTGQFSLAGAQSKFALHHLDGQWGIPSGRTPTTHIIKPAIAGMADQDINEHVTMRAARLSGLAVPVSEVRGFASERAFVVTRYDRVRFGDDIVRVHQEDMGQALGVWPANKYEARGGPSAVDVARLIRRSVDRAHVDEDVASFADALVFNWIVLGTDAHAKNYALLLAAGQVRLAPLYDLNSFLPYAGGARPSSLSMGIGGIDDAGLIGAAQWRSLAKDVGLDDGRLLDRIRALLEIVPEAMSAAAADDAVAALQSDLPSRLVDLVATRSAMLAKRLRADRSRSA